MPVITASGTRITPTQPETREDDTQGQQDEAGEAKPETRAKGVTPARRSTIPRKTVTKIRGVMIRWIQENDAKRTEKASGKSRERVGWEKPKNSIALKLQTKQI